jgi:hypothetical protein
MSLEDELEDRCDDAADSLLSFFIEGYLDEGRKLIGMLEERDPAPLGAISQLRKTNKFLSTYRNTHLLGES